MYGSTNIHVISCLHASCTNVSMVRKYARTCSAAGECPAMRVSRCLRCELSHGVPKPWLASQVFVQKRMVRHDTTWYNHRQSSTFRLRFGFFTLEQGQFKVNKGDTCVAGVQNQQMSCLVVSCGRLDCAAPRLSNSSTA